LESPSFIVGKLPWFGSGGRWRNSKALSPACRRTALVSAPPDEKPVAEEVKPDSEAATPEADKTPETDPKPTATPHGGQDRPQPKLASMTGSLQSFVDQGRPVSSRIVSELGKAIGFSLEDDVTSVVKSHEEHRKTSRAPTCDRDPVRGVGPCCRKSPKSGLN
jgi:hypothetical protein